MPSKVCNEITYPFLNFNGCTVQTVDNFNINGAVKSYAVVFIPDNKVHDASMGPIWGRQDPGGPHVGPMNLAIWDIYDLVVKIP